MNRLISETKTAVAELPVIGPVGFWCARNLLQRWRKWSELIATLSGCDGKIYHAGWRLAGGLGFLCDQLAAKKWENKSECKVFHGRKIVGFGNKITKLFGVNRMFFKNPPTFKQAGG